MLAPNNLITAIFWIIGGLGLFLFGIELMGRSLRKASGSVLRRGLDYLTRTRFHGLITGAFITALLQSSSATTVMVVGFITAGLLSFSKSIGLILGANIGTTITLQITALNLDAMAVPLIGLGFLLNFFARKRLVRRLGTACMGFGILFLGLVLMKFAVSNYGADIRGWLELCTNGGLSAKLFAFILALIVTLIIQSSAATIAMLQVIALQSEHVGLVVAIPIILGAHIGTCITAILASLKASTSGKRAAMANLIFNIVGGLITVGLFRFYIKYIPLTADGIEHQIANCHMAIKLVNVAIFLPFTHLFAKLIVLIIPGADKFNAAPEFLDYKDIKDSERAMGNVRNEIRRMCGICLDIIKDSVNAFFTKDEMLQEEILKREDLVDDLYKSTADYVLEISRRTLPAELALHPVRLMHVMSDVERIGDHAENIVELSQAFARDQVNLSNKACEDIRTIIQMIEKMGFITMLLFDNPSEERLLELIDIRDALHRTARTMLASHAQRLAIGECSVTSGIVFVDVITNLRRVANHLKSISNGLIGRHSAEERVEL